MVLPRTTIWEIERHTEAKHRILRKYLEAWFPILSTRSNNLFYVDGFAGPGEYKDGQIGSPIIAIKAALEHKLVDRLSNINFIFIEKDKKRFDHLTGILETMRTDLPSKFRLFPFNSLFDEQVRQILTDFDKSGAILNAGFVFIDPFGYSGIPMTTIKRLMSTYGCEVLITFSCDSINRWLGDETKDRSELDALFHSTDWRKAESLESGTRVSFLVDLYLRQLHRICDVRYVRQFSMEGDTGHLVYALVFGTNSIEGLKHMKRAMCKVDPSGGYIFSDRTNPDQQNLINFSDGKYHIPFLRDMILARFSGRTASIRTIERFVWADTPFCFEHVKREILKPFESEGVIRVTKSPRKKAGTYPAGTVIEFTDSDV